MISSTTAWIAYSKFFARWITKVQEHVQKFQYYRITGELTTIIMPASYPTDIVSIMQIPKLKKKIITTEWNNETISNFENIKANNIKLDTTNNYDKVQAF